MSAPACRAQRAVLCEYERASSGCRWRERLEFWLLPSGGYLLGALQVVGDDCAAEEIWLSREVDEAPAVWALVDEWADARRPTATAVERAAARLARVLAEWAPGIEAEMPARARAAE